MTIWKNQSSWLLALFTIGMVNLSFAAFNLHRGQQVHKRGAETLGR